MDNGNAEKYQNFTKSVQEDFGIGKTGRYRLGIFGSTTGVPRCAEH